MILSNLHIEYNSQYYIKGEKKQTRVVCNIETGWCKEKEMFFCVDDEFSEWLTCDVYDAFLVACIYPAMYYNEPIEIQGKVSKRLYFNINHYVKALVKDYEPSFNDIKISVKGFSKAEKNIDTHVGTGFSGGVDSFSTLQDNFFEAGDEEYKIDTLFFFNVGQYGNVINPKTWERAKNRFNLTRNFAREIGVNAVELNTNLFDFYMSKWEYDAGILIRICSVLVFQKALRRYYISNTSAYEDMFSINVSMSDRNHADFAEYVDPIIMPLLAPEGVDIVCDGAQYKRTKKEQRIANNPYVKKYLNVCVNSSDEHTAATNCSECSKCMRTMMAYESLGILDQFMNVFDINKYKKNVFAYKCKQIVRYHVDVFAQDNINFAREHHNPLPFKFIAYIYYYLIYLLNMTRIVIGKMKKLIRI